MADYRPTVPAGDRQPAPCAHCGVNRARPHKRGLCERCYSDRDVRDQHPRGKYQVYADDEWAAADAPPPESPTGAAPGSPEKVLVMMARRRLRVQLHHPGDRHLRDAAGDEDAYRGLAAAEAFLRAMEGLAEPPGENPPRKAA